MDGYVDANLEYVIDGQRIVVDSGELETLDTRIFRKYSSFDDVFEHPKNRDELGTYSRDGYFVVSFGLDNVPVEVLDKYVKLGGNPLAGNQCFSAIFGRSEVIPSIRGIKRRLIRLFTSEEVAKEFYELFEDEYTAKEKFDYVLGMTCEDNDLIASGVRRIINDYTSGPYGYFTGRALLERMNHFESVKNAAKEASEAKQMKKSSDLKPNHLTGKSAI